jgi:hypothetical protein
MIGENIIGTKTAKTSNGINSFNSFHLENDVNKDIVVEKMIK